MHEWMDIQTKTELEFVLEDLCEEIRKQRIKRIFSADSGVPKEINEEICYSTLDQSLYILFENDYRLKIVFLEYSSIDISYGQIIEEELEEGIGLNNEKIDYLNCHHDIHGWNYDENGKLLGIGDIVETIDMKGEYGNISNITVNGFHDEFWKWVNGYNHCSMILIPAGGDYFDSITFIFDNGIEISMCPQDAAADGYYDLIIKDKNNVIQYKSLKSNLRKG